VLKGAKTINVGTARVKDEDLDLYIRNVSGKRGNLLEGQVPRQNNAGGAQFLIEPDRLRIKGSAPRC